MRKARQFINFQFSPATLEDYVKIANAYELEENAYLRQVLAYWEMAASFVRRGVLHPIVFQDTCSEGIFVFAKFRPLLHQIRDKRDPDFLENLETIVRAHPALEKQVNHLADWLAARAQAAAGSG